MHIETHEVRHEPERRGTDRRRTGLHNLTADAPGQFEYDRRCGERRGTQSATSRSEPRRSLEELTRLTQKIADEMHADLEVLGVIGARARAAYVEILLRMRNCDYAPCRIIVGMDRNLTHDDLRDAIAPPIREYLRRRGSRRPA